MIAAFGWVLTCFAVLETKRPGQNHEASRNRCALARTVNAGRGTESAGDGSESARGQATRGVGEVRVVKNVVSLEAEGELNPLLDGEDSLQGRIQIEVPRAPEAVGGDVAPVGLERNRDARAGVGGK